MDEVTRETTFLWIESRKGRKRNFLNRTCISSLSTITSSVTFDESSMGTLLFVLRNVPLVVTYNCEEDLKILEKYNRFSPLKETLRCVNIMKAIEVNCDFRPFFLQTIQHTLGNGIFESTEPEIEVGNLYRTGNLLRAVEISEVRSRALKDLYLFVMTNGFVHVQHKDGGPVKKVKVISDFLQPSYFNI
jgi:hypothetical protein